MRGREVFGLLLHVSCFYAYYYALSHENKELQQIHSRSYGGRWKFLTFLNEILQAGYFGLSIVNDLFGSNVRPGDGEKKSALQKLRDYVLAALAFPLGTFVVITFWGIYAVDRELVYPSRLDGIIPPWLNHIMHTTVLPFLLLEIYFVYHDFPKRSRGLTGTVGFALLYQIWILWIAFHAGIWVYPVMEVLSWPGRLAFFAVLWVFMLVIYITGESLNNTFWGVKHKKQLKTK